MTKTTTPSLSLLYKIKINTIGIILCVLSVGFVQAEKEVYPGVKLNSSLTLFGQSGFSNLEDTRSSAAGGKFDLGVQINANKLGLWPGFFITAGFDTTFGNTVDSLTSDFILPVNTALAVPDVDDDNHSFSLLLTQAFSRKTMITLGKFNMLKLSEKRLKLTSGGGATGFQNLGLALPLSGVLPPYAMGGLFRTSVNDIDFSLFVYDPRDAEAENVLDDLFSDGVTYNASMTVPWKIGELPGYHTFNAVYSTQKGLDLSNASYLLLPFSTQEDVGQKNNYTFFAYSFRQYLQTFGEDKGWGIFGRMAFSDGNPNPIQSSYQIGLAGNSPIIGREDDTWGIGYFRYNFSNNLVDSLTFFDEPLLRDEQGVEAFYNYTINDHITIGANIQVIRPGVPGADTETIGSLKLRFEL